MKQNKKHKKEQLKYFILICIVVFFLSLNGFSEYTDINNSNIFTSLFVDAKTIIPNQDTYKIGGTIVDIKSSGNTTNLNKSSIVSGEGDSLNAARKTLESKLSNESFFGALRSVLMSKDFSEKGIEEFILRLKYQLNSRLTVPIYTIEDDYNEMLTVNSKNDYSAPFEFEGIINTLNQKGYGIRVNVSEILENISNGITSYIIPNMSLDENEEEKSIQLQGYSIFSNNKLIDNISFSNSVGLLYILNKNAVSTYYAIVEGKNSTIYCGKANDKYNVFIKDGYLDIQYCVNIVGEIIETQIEKIDDNDLCVIQNIISSKIKKEIEDAFYHSFDLNVDYLNITKRCIAKNQDITHSDVNNMLKKSKVNVFVNVDIKNNYVK